MQLLYWNSNFKYNAGRIFFHAAADAKQIIENKNWSLRSQKSMELASSVARSVVPSKVNLFLTYDTASKSAYFGEVI